MHFPLARLAAAAALALASVGLHPWPASALTSDPDMSTWMANGKIHASVQYGDVMFIGGTFQKLREVMPPGVASGPQITGLTGLAALDMSTGAGIASFKPQLAASGAQLRDVQSLAIVGNTLYVGGQFSSVDGQPRLNLAAIDIDPATLVGRSIPTSLLPSVIPPATLRRSRS